MRWRWWKTRAEKQAIADAVASKLIGPTLHRLTLNPTPVLAGNLVTVRIEIEGIPRSFAMEAPRNGIVVGFVLAESEGRAFSLYEFIYTP